MFVKRVFLIALFLLFSVGVQRAFSQSYAEDTVWTKKTDQSEGFWMVKFSDHDSIIAAHGYNDVLFFDAFSGEEIKRLFGNKEVFFINNDKNFIKLNENRIKIDIFNTKSFLLSDSLQNDGSLIGAMNTSNDKKLFIATINNGTGIRIWDILTKKILKTKYFDIDNDPNLISTDRKKVFFNCNSTEFILTTEKQYKGSNNNTYFKTYHAIFNTDTFDSVGVINTSFYRLSHDCSKIAYLTGNPTYGVEIYDFNTKELIWKIPINGPSLTGIEFSPDDKYLVTSNGPGANCLKIWSMENGENQYGYSQTSFKNIDITHDGKFLIFSVGNSLKKLYTRYGGTTVETHEQDPILIYPNPTHGLININFNNPINEITKISLNDINGIQLRDLYNGILDIGQQSVSFDVNDLANGTYFINVNNSHISLNFKLIINK